MAHFTIAQLREKEVYRLAAYANPTPTDADIKNARSIMVSFYRYCGLCDRLLYYTNDERTANRQWVKDLETKADRWDARLKKALKPYGLTIFYCSWLPSIGIRDEHGCCSEKITRWFYN